MTCEAMLKETGIENIVEGEFKRETDPPYICHLRSGTNNVNADGKTVHNRYLITIELYCDKNDKQSVERLKNVFKNHNVSYSEGVFWIGGNQQLYLYVYTITDKEEKY